MRTLTLLFALSLATAVSLCNTKQLFAQDQERYRIETRDGNIFTGVLISEDDETVVLEIQGVGEISIPKGTIRYMVLLDQRRLKGDVYWYDNPQATRYFFAPNAIALAKGRGYYQNTWILFNNVNYGISNHVSLGAGMVPLFLFGISASPVWILPKVTIPVSDEMFHIGAGAMIGGLVGSTTEGLGLFYGVGTLGSRDKNITIGLGYGYAGTDVSQTPLINVSGMIRTGRRVYLLTENYLITDGSVNGILSFGARWTSETIAVDFGLFRPIEGAGGLIGVPWLGVTIPFGNR